MNRSEPEIVAATWAADEPQIRSVRRVVFVLEQGVPEERDFDGTDAACCHVLAFLDGQAVATGRMEADGHLGRIAVVKGCRGGGIGSAIMRFLIGLAQRQGLGRVYLNAQLSAVGFYEKLGFSTTGEEFLDTGIEHIRMERGSDLGQGETRTPP